jgi:hypothetical protein
MSSVMQVLVDSLQARWMPEQVAQSMLAGDIDFTDKERHLLSSAVPKWARSSMPTTFAKVAGLDRQLKVASELFPQVKPPTERTPEALGEYLAAMQDTLRMDGTDFKANRLTHAQRKSSRGRKGQPKLVPNGHRAYNKRFRFLARMAEHISTRATTAEMRELAQIAKSRLAFKLDRSVLTNLKTVCFVAYMTAKLNKRSIFTFGDQENPYDNIADMLFKRLGRGTNWLAVAYVHPEPEVLMHLDDRQKGTLLGVWFSVMTRAVKVLDREAGGVDLKSFIVRRGNDSSTWNEAAGAYNKARDGWMNTLYALGMEDALDAFVPGKALRLMAADVAWGHRHYGDGLDPNTAVFNELPKPWDVMLHDVTCTRAMVEAACTRHKVKSGWVTPKTKSVAKYTPTPELVHGVIVSSPELAATLKAVGYFGGPSKGPAKDYVPISKTLDGLTIKVSGSPSLDEMFDRVNP